MLEILYDTATLEVRAWNADEDAQGLYTPTPDQAVVILPITPPTFQSDWYKVDLANQVIVGNPDYSPFSPDYLRACELLASSPNVITMPEMWEILRIFGHHLGYRFD